MPTDPKVPGYAHPDYPLRGRGVGRCEDCKSPELYQSMFLVCEPVDPTSELDARLFYLCRSCWDRLVAAATLEAFR